MRFQYRKRYEVTCDSRTLKTFITSISFQYRKRYEVTCDPDFIAFMKAYDQGFQYRKRYEVTCDLVIVEDSVL